MGFGFNLFVVPILVSGTLGLLAWYLFTKKKFILLILACIWAFVIFLFGLNILADRVSRPIKLSKNDLIGEYRIDTNFYPGKNARWQYEQYRFELSSDDSLHFYQLRKDNTPGKFSYKVIYTDRPGVWKINFDSTNTILKHLPILFRGPGKFYYVLPTDQYGNMFFRKSDK